MDEVIELYKRILDENSLIKIIFSRPKSGDIVKVTGRSVEIKGELCLQTEAFMSDGKVIHRNIVGTDRQNELLRLTKEYRQINIQTSGGNCEILVSKNGKLHMSNKIIMPLVSIAPSKNDRQHSFILDPEKAAPFLSKLGVCDENGRIFDKKRAKFKQINRFVEIIDDVYRFLPEQGTLHICDFCCGKSYLTFAVYYYLTQIKNRDVKMYGVDLKKDVISFCREIAQELSFTGMEFTCGNIFDFHTNEHIDLVISLHACDIATDMVLYNAVRLNAGVILSTPCCHHEMMNQLSCSSLQFVQKQSMYKQKLCDALTDALRCKRLESLGYKVTALELVDPEETPKNILIKAIKSNVSKEKMIRANQEYDNAVSFLGVQPYFDKLLKSSSYDFTANEAFSLTDIIPTDRFIPTDTISFDEIPALRRFDRSNKGDYGTVCVIAGGKNMPGACYLAAKAAYSCGAGLVRVITHESNRALVLSLLPEAVIHAYSDDTPVKDICEMLSKSTTAVLGPGLGQNELSKEIVHYILGTFDIPLVLDADGLNLSVGSDLIKNYKGPLVITPHMMEASRLLNTPLEKIRSDPAAALEMLYERFGHTAVLKDAHTLIMGANGRYINNSGNNGMSTGGSGDVLSGIAGTLINKASDMTKAAAFAVYLHGLCGDRAAKKHGKHAMLASHVLDEIENVLKEFEQ